MLSTRAPGTTGWRSIAVFPRTSKQFYGQVVLHGYSGNSFAGVQSVIGASTLFDKVTRPDKVIPQLGQPSSDRDVWL